MIIFWLGLLAGVHVIYVWIVAIFHGLLPKYRPLPRQAPASAVWPFASVIVPAWQERGTLELCIRSLCNIDYPVWEVIIVAGGQDGTYESAVKSCKGIQHFHVLKQKPSGKNAALNQALHQARGEIIVVL